MAAELKLNLEEVVLVRTGGIGYGGSMFGGKNDELILTNQALLLVKKNLFGKSKDILRFPLNDIRIVNGKVQAVMGKKDIATPTLDVYFKSGCESFLFAWKKDVQQWINYINAAVAGEPIPQKGELDDLFEDVEKMAAFMESFSGSVSESINKVKDVLGIKSQEKVAMKCLSCGASLVGVRGETIECPYCGTYVKF